MGMLEELAATLLKERAGTRRRSASTGSNGNGSVVGDLKEFAAAAAAGGRTTMGPSPKTPGSMSQATTASPGEQ